MGVERRSEQLKLDWARIVRRHHAYIASNRRGFTVVELLIVIVVIGILAAIALVAYNGVTGKAREASLKSDLKNNSTQLEIDLQRSGSYPGSAGAANDGQGLKTSSGNSMAYAIKPYGYCLAASNSALPTSFVLKSVTGQITNGDCTVAVSSIAGSAGAYADVDNTGAAARFNWPEGIAVDRSGTLYVADWGNDKIRKVSPAGVVSTLASVTAVDVAVDSAGTVYAVDYRCVRKITPAGAVSIFAGDCVTNGYVDATGTAARFWNANGIDVDASGVAYVADSQNNCIRKISPAGVVTTFAGACGTPNGFADGTGSTARFAGPRSVSFGEFGSIYVADTSNNCVRKISSSAVVSTFAGSCGNTFGFQDGTGAAAKFATPWRLDADASGAVYVIDTGNYRVRAITTSGVVSTVAGTGTAGSADGSDTTAKLGEARGIAVSSDGTIYVADSDNCLIRKIRQ